MEYKDALGFPPVMVQLAEKYSAQRKEEFERGKRELMVQGTKLKLKTKDDEIAENLEAKSLEGKKVEKEKIEGDKEKIERIKELHETEKKAAEGMAKKRAEEVLKFKTDMEKNKTELIDKKARAIGKLAVTAYMEEMGCKDVEKIEKIKQHKAKEDFSESSKDIRNEVFGEMEKQREENFLEQLRQDIKNKEPKNRRRIIAEKDCEQIVRKQEKKIPPIPVLGTWNNRGKAQPIRLMLAYLGFKYREKRYQCGPPPDYDCSAWLDEKDKLGLDFPELPYYLDGDIKLTHAHVIMRHFAERFDLEPKTETEKINVNIAEQMAMEMMRGLRNIFHKSDFEDLMKFHLDSLELRYFSKWFGDRKWFAGDRITYVDFMMYEALSQHNRLEYRSFHDCLNFLEFMKRFENIQSIHKYLKSGDAILWPLCGEFAIFGARCSKVVSMEYPKKEKFVREIIHNMDLDLEELPKVEEYRYLRFNPLHPMYKK